MAFWSKIDNPLFPMSLQIFIIRLIRLIYDIKSIIFVILSVTTLNSKQFYKKHIKSNSAELISLFFNYSCSIMIFLFCLFDNFFIDLLKSD
jgi:hypothetical protein